MSKGDVLEIIWIVVLYSFFAKIDGVQLEVNADVVLLVGQADFIHLLL